MHILYEDDYLLAADKPAGLQAERDRSGNPSLEAQAAEYLEKTYPWKKQLVTGVVHRLDRQVSGVMLFAKTPMALKTLSSQFETRVVQKIYLALVENTLPQPSGELTHWLRKDVKNRRAVVSNKNHSQAQECRLRYRLLEVPDFSDAYRLVEIDLLTGRYHQIRAQMSAVGCPIMGDEKYGSKRRFNEEMICLHAFRLVVRHPRTGERLSFEAPLPENAWWEAIG